MKKSRNIFLILIAVFALLASSISIFPLITQLLELLKDFSSDLMSMYLDLMLTSIVDLVFAFMEISFGVSLIKEVKKNNYFECYKQTSGLLNVIITPLFLNMLINIVFSFIYKNPVVGVDITLIVLFIVVMSLASFVRPLVLKRTLKGLDIVILLSSILTLAIFMVDYKNCFAFTEDAYLDAVSNIVNCIMIILLIALSIISLITYSKEPELEIAESRANEDVDVIESYVDDEYEKVKIYSFRGVDNNKSTCSKVLEIIGCVFCLAFSILFFIENKFNLFFEESFDKFIDAFSFSSAEDIYASFELIVRILIVLLTLLYSINYFIGIIINNPKYKIYSIYVTRIGSLLLTILFLTRAISLISVIANRNFKITDLNIFDAVLLITYIANSFARKSFKHSIKKIEEGIQHTDTYHEHINTVVSVNIAYGIISCVCLFLYSIYSYLSSEVLYLSFGLLIVSIILITIGTVIEKKNPISEYIIVKRKKYSLKQ